MLALPRSQYYYSSVKDDSEIIDALQQLASDHPAYGFRKLYAYLRRSGKAWNHKKVYRVYKLLKLNKRRRLKRRLPQRVKQPLMQQSEPNRSWSMDFMSDSLACSRKFRTLNVIDDHNREVLAIEIAISIGAQRVIRTLDRIIERYGSPKTIRVDNGPEFTSKELQWWSQAKQIELQFIQPGRPMQNAFIERLNGSYRREVLDAYMFFDLEQVQTLTDQWIDEYNYRRPHEALKNLTPIEYKDKLKAKL